ncbi:hypothetical protein TNCT_53131 [Trichonephila clavata]|uniref:TIL domain-containing protein n=1 Tax=Trichonephila clavata TaxID=2740835 RepID=A0A8X6FVP5_TRICU|nr:hypothetical protein TNCT_53131 [Trichonephila clavata]
MMKTFLVICILSVNVYIALSAKCPSHQHEESCGTLCPITCENRNDPTEACVIGCSTGCVCDEGYIKLKDKSGPCVKPSKCPQQ